MKKLGEYLSEGFVFIPVVVCYLVRDGRVLLGLRKRVSYGLGLNLISGIGGKIGDMPEFANETTEQAVEREVLEEIGVRVKTYTNLGRVRWLFPSKPKWCNDAQVFIVTEWEGEPIETEDMKPIWFDISSLPHDQMWEDNAHWVPHVLNGKVVDAGFLFDADGKIEEHFVNFI